MHSTLSENRPFMRYHDQQLRSWQDVLCTQTRGGTAKYTYHPIDIIPKMYHKLFTPATERQGSTERYAFIGWHPPLQLSQQLALFLLMLLNKAFKERVKNLWKKKGWIEMVGRDGKKKGSQNTKEDIDEKKKKHKLIQTRCVIKKRKKSCLIFWLLHCYGNWKRNRFFFF